MRFKVNDIVYILPSPKRAGKIDWPCINSIHEIDCKIISVNDGGYTIITGKGIQLWVEDSELVSPSEKHLYLKNCVTALIDTELFSAGTVFVDIGEYYANELSGIYISKERFLTIKYIFK